ncbi:GNAT family N-acetyltransferase [Streptomyces sp. NPDC001941]|uniref:GNAT family N-acetyltransferase n=1 Tax=Streptomyces sp. NPDC001941 TaxID=3154659 RepID=UPI00332640F3
MHDLRFQQPDSDATLAEWRHVHNTVIPTHVLSLDEVRERAGRNHLEVVHAGGELVGCTTVRPPQDGSRTATVIARTLPEHRGRGYGALMYAHGLERARELGAEVVETVVLSSNEDGLRFALKHGFTELERYVLPGETVPWIDLRLVEEPDEA